MCQLRSIIMSLTHEELLELLSYDENTGLFQWIGSKQEEVLGSSAGSLVKGGYISITINGKAYRAHRLAWFYKYKVWPIGGLDHINRIRSENWIKNLREASAQQNAFNSSVRSDSLTGVRGVRFNLNKTKYVALIRVNKRSIHLGTFINLEDASSAYRSACKKHFGVFAPT